MDLLDFEVDSLYFDSEKDERIDALIEKASANYGDAAAELALLQAYFLAPESLNVLIALNRFYYYQHQLNNAMTASNKAFKVIRMQLEFPEDWRQVQLSDIEALPANNMTTLRMYLFCLKSIGFLNMRLNKLELSQMIFEKLVELDSEDRIGAEGLLELTIKTQQEQQSGSRVQ